MIMLIIEDGITVDGESIMVMGMDRPVPYIAEVIISDADILFQIASTCCQIYTVITFFKSIRTDVHTVFSGCTAIDELVATCGVKNLYTCQPAMVDVDFTRGISNIHDPAMGGGQCKIPE